MSHHPQGNKQQHTPPSPITQQPLPYPTLAAPVAVAPLELTGQPLAGLTPDTAEDTGVMELVLLGDGPYPERADADADADKP